MLHLCIVGVHVHRAQGQVNWRTASRVKKSHRVFIDMFSPREVASMVYSLGRVGLQEDPVLNGTLRGMRSNLA